MRTVKWIASLIFLVPIFAIGARPHLSRRHLWPNHPRSAQIRRRSFNDHRLSAIPLFSAATTRVAFSNRWAIHTNNSF